MKSTRREMIAGLSVGGVAMLFWGCGEGGAARVIGEIGGGPSPLAPPRPTPALPKTILSGDQFDPKLAGDFYWSIRSAFSGNLVSILSNNYGFKPEMRDPNQPGLITHFANDAWQLGFVFFINQIHFELPADNVNIVVGDDILIHKAIKWDGKSK